MDAAEARRPDPLRRMDRRRPFASRRLSRSEDGQEGCNDSAGNVALRGSSQLSDFSSESPIPGPLSLIKPSFHPFNCQKAELMAMSASHGPGHRRRGLHSQRRTMPAVRRDSDSRRLVDAAFRLAPLHAVR